MADPVRGPLLRVNLLLLRVAPTPSPLFSLSLGRFGRPRALEHRGLVLSGCGRKRFWVGRPDTAASRSNHIFPPGKSLALRDRPSSLLYCRPTLRTHHPPRTVSRSRGQSGARKSPSPGTCPSVHVLRYMSPGTCPPVHVPRYFALEPTRGPARGPSNGPLIRKGLH